MREGPLPLSEDTQVQRLCKKVAVLTAKCGEREVDDCVRWVLTWERGYGRSRLHATRCPGSYLAACFDALHRDFENSAQRTQAAASKVKRKWSVIDEIERQQDKMAEEADWSADQVTLTYADESI